MGFKVIKRMKFQKLQEEESLGLVDQYGGDRMPKKGFCSALSSS